MDSALAFHPSTMATGETETDMNERRRVHWAEERLEQQLGSLSLQEYGQPGIQSYFLPPPATSLHTTTAYHLRRMGLENQMFGGMSNEFSYLLENLQRQHDRGQRLSYALSNIETRLASAQSKGESRKLRKEAGLLKSKIAESNKQERLIAMRLSHMQNEDLSRLYQAQQPAPLPYPYSSLQPWGQMALSPMTPMTPISPLSPLPPGIYHPVPTPPSPLEAPFFLSPPVLLYNPVVPYEQNYFFAVDHQGSYVPEQYDAALPVNTEETRRRSVEYTATRALEGVLSGQERIGRRWSLADAFSPSPRDKRMSMPGLQTIWRY